MIPEALSQTTSQAITQFANDAANSSTGQRYNDYMKDIPSSGGLLKEDKSFDAGLGYDDKALGDAIKAKYSVPYRQEKNKLAFGMLKHAQGDYLKKLSIASQLANQEHVQNQERIRLIRAEQDAKRRKRGAIVGTVLGLGGAVAGGFLGSAGGPAGTAMGASAGFQLGSGVGSMMGEGGV